MPTRRPARMRRRPAPRSIVTRPGFTLLELIVVIAIVATIAAITTPRYSAAIGRYRVEAAAKRIAADLGYARRVAMSTSAATTVSFDVLAGRYTCLGITGPDRSGPPYVVDLSSGVYRAHLTLADLDDPTADDVPNAVTFDGHGQPDSAGQIVVASGAESRTVLLDGVTGVASVD